MEKLQNILLFGEGFFFIAKCIIPLPLPQAPPTPNRKECQIPVAV